jgi:DNA-binding GntR family transcriptional regulator
MVPALLKEEGISKKKELLSDKAYKAVRRMIAVHRFEPGFHLNVEKLSREVGISRVPLWEAIRRLQQEGIVQHIPRRGVFLSESSLKRTLEIIEVRGVLDKLGGRLACERISDRKLGQLAKCLPDQLRAIENEDIALYSSSDLRFHGLIYDASGNDYLKEVFGSITLAMLPTRVDLKSIFVSLHMAHQEILEGLMNRDCEQVEMAFTRHEEIVVNHVKNLLKSENERKEMVRRIKEDFPPFKELENKAGNNAQDS